MTEFPLYKKVFFNLKHDEVPSEGVFIQERLSGKSVPSLLFPAYTFSPGVQFISGHRGTSPLVSLSRDISNLEMIDGVYVVVNGGPVSRESVFIGSQSPGYDIFLAILRQAHVLRED